MSKKYLSIYSDLVGKIEQGYYQPGELLPSEKKLIAQYDVSRDTVRKSLDILVQNGYIYKEKGKGSFVQEINQLPMPVSKVISYREFQKQVAAEESWTSVEHLGLVRASTRVRGQLLLEEEEQVWSLLRTRTIGGEKVILEKDFIREKYVQTLTREIGEDSLYGYIEDELGLKISHAKKEILLQMATEEDRTFLDMKKYDMVAVVRSRVYLEGDILFQFTESRHRPDKFKFVAGARRSS